MTPARRHPILARIVVFSTVVLALTAWVRSERGFIQDPRLPALNACGVDGVRQRLVGTVPAFLELQSGDQMTAQLSLIDSSVTAGDTHPLVGVAGAWFDEARRAPLGSNARGAHAVVLLGDTSSHARRRGRYEVDVLPQLGTAQLSLRARLSGGVPVRRVGLAVTVRGFQVRVPGVREVHGRAASARTGRPWAALTNARCTIVVWGHGLERVDASWRTRQSRFADLVFYLRPSGGGDARLNVTFLYGEALRPAAAALSGWYSGSVDALLARLRAELTLPGDR
ncbi:MAG TPA: hypothetical protein VFB42_10640 [Gaiellaceae bacterium]|nr:hypothetical protein [Gaiellaceae bacterium]